MTKRQTEQRVLVTGASRGIGRAVAAALGELGYRVTGTSRTPDRIEQRMDGIEYVRLDLADDASIEACARQVGDVDVLINNAGQSQIGAAEDVPMESVREDFQVNLFGIIRLVQAFLPGMRTRGEGFIINVGSMTSRFAIPYQSIYTASKFALAGFSWALRNEVMQHGIKVVVVEPNDIRTTIEPRVFTGETPGYEKAISRMRQVRDRRMADAPGPEIVARKVVAILAKRNPAPFYAVGGMGPFLVFLKRFFPDKTVERIVRKNYDLE